VRYWVAEHHLNPGVAGTCPPLVMSLVAGATHRIRVGSGAVQTAHQTPLAIVEQFGLLDAAYPGRIDLGLGRSVLRRSAAPAGGSSERPSTTAGSRVGRHRTDGADGPRTTERGLVIPKPFSFASLVRSSPRFALQSDLLQQPEARTPPYTEQVETVLALLAGSYHSRDGVPARVVPGEGADLQVWITGSSGGESAGLAGRHGLPFAANYHVAPAAILDAVAAYRTAFRPSPRCPRPRVMVSADVVVGPDDATARRLASGYGLWVRSIRTGMGAIPFPTPEEADAHEWTDDDRALVEDRVSTQFVGSAATVAERLEVLVAETGADELLITTITHDHADRVRSYELLAEHWASAPGGPAGAGAGRQAGGA
jgi:alkanesulfonate monooxygenase SsuD/methylene tetrahydromethanopterin reductase-like flavin-dependent oxidoreductase (luciferase family)